MDSNRRASVFTIASSSASSAKKAKKPTANHCNVELNFALFTAVANGRYRQTKLLIDAGAKVNGVDEYGRTPLIICCLQQRDQRKLLKVLKLLIECGADPNVRDGEGRTAIMYAAIMGLTDVTVHLLEQSSINLEFQDTDGNTVLMHAASNGHVDVVSVLLKQMGRLRQVLHLTQRNHHGHTALELAERNGHYEIVSKLGGGAADRPPPLCHPGQLDRGPTPATPLAFPSRLRMQINRRKSSEEKDWPSLLGASPIPNTDDETRNHKVFPSLSKLQLKDDHNVAVDLNSSYSSSKSEPLPERQRPNVDGVDSGYHEVLNRLDLSIRRSSPTVRHRDLNPEAEVQQQRGTNRVMCNGSRNYFPPIRPLNKECRSIIAKHKDR